MELLLTGKTVGAADAYRLGLVNRVVPPEQLASAADDLISDLASLSGRILRHTRRAALLGSSGPFDQALTAVENLYLQEMMQAHDAHEGLAAFMEKRQPVWRDE